MPETTNNELTMSLIKDIENLKRARAIIDKITEIPMPQLALIIQPINENIDELRQRLDDLETF